MKTLFYFHEKAMFLRKESFLPLIPTSCVFMCNLNNLFKLLISWNERYLVSMFSLSLAFVIMCSLFSTSPSKYVFRQLSSWRSLYFYFKVTLEDERGSLLELPTIQRMLNGYFSLSLSFMIISSLVIMQMNIIISVRKASLEWEGRRQMKI